MSYAWPSVEFALDKRPRMLALHRKEELKLLKKVRKEAAQPERYPER